MSSNIHSLSPYLRVTALFSKLTYVLQTKLINVYSIVLFFMNWIHSYTTEITVVASNIFINEFFSTPSLKTLPIVIGFFVIQVLLKVMKFIVNIF